MALSQKTRVIVRPCHSYSNSWWASEGDKIYYLQKNFVGEALEEASRPFRGSISRSHVSELSCMVPTWKRKG